MEVDSDLEMVTIPEPAGTFLYGCNFGVQSLRHGVGYTMLEIGQHIEQMPRNKFRRLDHGGQAAVCRPEIPALPETLGTSRAALAPQFAQRLLQRPRPPRLQVVPLDIVKSFTGLSGHVLGVVQLQVLAARQGGVSRRHQRLVLLPAHPIDPTAYMLHDMEPVEHHLLVSTRHVCPAGTDKGWPHVEADRLDFGTTLRPEGLEVGHEAFFFPCLIDTEACSGARNAWAFG